MQGIRIFIARYRAVAALLLVLALAMKAFVPTGFMVGTDTGRTLTVQICDGQGQTMLTRIALGSKGAQPDKTLDEHAKAAKDCPFTALSMASLDAGDALFVALALAFLLALGFLPAPPLRLYARRYHRPPLRAPPALS
ncbi:DUF2946 family protein [Novosphingobium sp. 1949]|uniref:DUF2946 family protein n=1 Tax=Novosphingobium organovorum TaxID=2930092 RepID=A0ABT0BBB4_9SPHN|nr:DUF2946 family protein [Novosphingobium organovorum]MCJ2182323.1 DUF2946 family protein [Novosphingobium organovorum]